MSSVNFIPHQIAEDLDDVLAGFGFVVSSPLRRNSHLKVLTVAAPLAVIVEEIDGVGCRLISEDGVFHFIDLGYFHIKCLSLLQCGEGTQAVHCHSQVHRAALGEPSEP